MKRPTKKKKQKRTISKIFDVDCSYTPEDLRSIATLMEANNIILVDFDVSMCWDQSIFECNAVTMETDDEFEERYQAEYKAWKRWKVNEKIREQDRKSEIIKEAAKLGLTLKDDGAGNE